MQIQGGTEPTCHDQQHGCMHADWANLAGKTLKGIHAAILQEDLVALPLKDAAKLLHICIRESKCEPLLCTEMDPLC